MRGRFVSASRYLIAVAVVSIFVAARALMLYGAAETFGLVAGLYSGAGAKGSKALMLAALTYFLSQQPKKAKPSGKIGPSDETG
jgi:hypothetical protein